ncbi:hypothetical protein ACLBPK_27415, partial [Klebsiella pneumoniae]
EFCRPGNRGGADKQAAGLHDMPFVNRLCERVMVLEYGKPLFSGLMAEAIQHPDVISAYLGEANYA